MVPQQGDMLIQLACPEGRPLPGRCVSLLLLVVIYKKKHSQVHVGVCMCY